MKTLMIETVSNGWIVRPFSSRLDWGNIDQGIIAVYNNIHDLQGDLPKLLGAEFPLPPPSAPIGSSELTPVT